MASTQPISSENPYISLTDTQKDRNIEDCNHEIFYSRITKIALGVGVAVAIAAAAVALYAFGSWLFTAGILAESQIEVTILGGLFALGFLKLASYLVTAFEGIKHYSEKLNHNYRVREQIEVSRQLP